MGRETQSRDQCSVAVSYLPKKSSTTHESPQLHQGTPIDVNKDAIARKGLLDTDAACSFARDRWHEDTRRIHPDVVELDHKSAWSLSQGSHRSLSRLCVPSEALKDDALLFVQDIRWGAEIDDGISKTSRGLGEITHEHAANV